MRRATNSINYSRELLLAQGVRRQGGCLAAPAKPSVQDLVEKLPGAFVLWRAKERFG